MKKIFNFVLIMTLLLSIVGCSYEKKDEKNTSLSKDKSVNINNNLYGSWFASDTSDVDLVFYKEGTGIYNEVGKQINFTFSGNEKELNMLFGEMKSTVSCTYNIINDNLEFICGDVIFYKNFNRG